MSEFGERIVMMCAVCNTKHHDERKEVIVQDKQTGAYRKAICAICCCLDCVQLADDPIRKQIRPLMMGQTISNRFVLKDERDKVKEVRKLPGPLNMEEAIKSMQGVLGLEAPGSTSQHRLQQAVACVCRKNATSRCIACDEPLCMKCLKVHECE